MRTSRVPRPGSSTGPVLMSTSARTRPVTNVPNGARTRTGSDARRPSATARRRCSAAPDRMPTASQYIRLLGCARDAAQACALILHDGRMAGVTRRNEDADNTRRANRRWWDADADSYHAEHGEFLGDADF